MAALAPSPITPQRPGRRWLGVIPTVLLVASLTWAASVALVGGIDWSWAGLRLRSRDPWRALPVAALALALHWIALRPVPRPARLAASSHWLATRGLAVLVLTAVIGYWHFGVTAAGGLDSAGYVNAARLIASGRLSEPQPLARILPFAGAAQACAPLGFVVGADGESRVPRFALGLPILMAAADTLVGPWAVYRVPLAAAVVTLAVAFALGRHLSGATLPALFATTLLALSPTLANGAIQPMSDVPTTAWLLAAIWLAVVRGNRPVLAGACAGMAVLTRPVVGPTALVLAGVARGPGHARLCLGAIVLLFAVLQAWLGLRLHGSPWSSGYGETTSLFDASRMTTNLVVFARWTAVTHTPLVFVAWAAALIEPRTRRVAVVASLLATVTMLPYLAYFTWDDWEATRFLLPGLAPVLVVGACAIALLLERRLPAALVPLVLAGVALAAAASSVHFLREQRVFTWRDTEARYRRVGEWVRDHTPTDAVIVAALHGGSVLHYSGREPVRWDRIPPGHLRASVRALEAHGHRLWLVIDGASEPDLFYPRFADDLRALDLLPAASIQGVSVFEVRERSPGRAPGAAAAPRGP